MRKTVLAAGLAALAAGMAAAAAQAAPSYQPAVAQAFKDVCLTSLASGKSVEDVALGMGWTLTKLQPASGTPLSKSWAPPGTTRLFVSDNLLNGGLCEAGWYGGAANASLPGLQQQMDLAAERSTRFLYALGWRSLGDEGKGLIISIPHTSKAYPDKLVTVWVANFPAAPTLAMHVGPKSYP